MMKGLLNCGLRVAGHSTDCIVGCGSQTWDHRLRAAGHRLWAALLRAAGQRLWAVSAGHRLRAGGHMLWVANIAGGQNVVLRPGLLNCGLWFARLFRLGGCQLLDLSGYILWVTGYWGYQTSENYSLIAKELCTQIHSLSLVGIKTWLKTCINFIRGNTPIGRHMPFTCQ